MMMLTRALSPVPRPSVATRAFFGGKARGRASLTPFPGNYDVMERQCREAVREAMNDGVELIELEFPPGGLELASGDLEGNVECNMLTLRLRGICAVFEEMKMAEYTRVLFPDKVEARLALTGSSPTPDGIRAPEQAEMKSVWKDWPGKIDYVDDPNFLSVSGLDKLLGKKVSIAKRMDSEDAAFVVAYPSANISEFANTRDLYEDCVKGTGRPLIVARGELQRYISNYYPPFWNAGEMGPLREFAAKFTGVYVIYNFKGSNPAVLFRRYPEPWQVLRRRRDGELELVHTFENFVSVKDVALNILPRFP